MYVEGISRIQGSSTIGYSVWAEKIREAAHIKRLNTPVIEGVSDKPRNRRPAFRNIKPEVKEVYIINYTLTVPESLLYNGNGDKIWGISKNALIEINDLLKSNDVPQLPYIMKITGDTVEGILTFIKDKNISIFTDIRFIDSCIVPGMMLDRYL